MVVLSPIHRMALKQLVEEFELDLGAVAQILCTTLKKLPI
jgi:hypothetical protein